MNKKKILIIFSVLMLFLMISSVSAMDTNKTNDVVSNVDSNDDYGVISTTVIKKNVLTADNSSESFNKQSLSSDNDEILKDSATGSFSELNTLIKASQVGDVITLNKNYAYNSLTDNSNGVTIAKSITIDGDGHYIDGKNLARAFYIDGNNVTLKNIVIKSTYRDERGAAIVWNGENGELSNVYITDSNSTSPSGNLAGGGAIYWSGANGQVKNSRFANCIATANGGTIAVDAPNFRISGSSFERTTGFRAGGLWFSRLSTNSSVVYCNFTRCVGSQTNSNYGAGALFYQLVNGYINNCRFIQNSGYAAGAIIVPASASGDIYNCYFESNYGRANGAVVNYDGNLVNCTFVNNWGETDSCAVKVGNVAVDNCHFSGNYFNGTSNRRSVVYFASSGASISNSRFVNNVVPNYLFFIASNINYVTFEKCNVTGNNVNSVFYATTGSKYSFRNMRITSNTIANVVFQFNDGTEVNLVNNVIQGTYYPSGYTMKTFTPYNTLYVGPSATGDKSGSNRNNLITFADALLKINYGGTIYITSGTYEIGTVSFNNYIHFIGDSNKNTIIKNSVITFNTKYTSIKSVDFKNTRVSSGVRGISISNCIFEDFTSTSYLLSFPVAPQCKFTDNIVRNINAPIFNVGNDGDSLLVENVLFDKITSTNALFKYASGNNANNIYKNITVTNSHLDSLVSYYNPSSSNDQKYDEFNRITVKNVIFDGIFFNLKSSTYISHQTLKNFYLENVNAADLFILGKDSKVDNIFLKNVTSVSNVFKFSFKTEINNINLTSVNANTVLDFNNVTVIVNKLNLTNVKAGIGFLTSENSQLNNLNLKYSNFTSFMGNLQAGVELKNSVFSDFKGNIEVNGSNVKVVNCNFTRGDVISSTTNGGAIELIKGDNFIIDSCIFKENFANKGGAVYIRSVSNSSYILNSQFHNNIAISNGGAVFVGSGISYYIDSSTRSTFGTASKNNGLYDLGTIALMHIVWVSSTGTGNGTYDDPASFAKGYESVEPYGYIYFKGETDTFTGISSFEFNKPGLTFIGNKSTTLNNIPFVMAEYASGYKLYNIIFTGSSSVSAIIWKGKDGLIANCTFKNNGGDNIFRGAAIQVMQNNLKIVNSTFTNNTAGSDEEGYGGAIYCDALNLTVNNCKFSENGVYSRGSHIYLTENASGVLINNSQFNNGKIVANVGLGSAIFVLSESNVVISHSKFRNNKALNGGAININGIISILKIYNNEFSNNQATNGGAIAFTSTVVNNLLMYNNVYDSNNVTSKGGAIHSNIKINEKNSNFTKNKANDGGAIYLNVSSNLFNNLLFDENEAENGGAIFLGSNAAYTLVNNSKFINNKGVGSALIIRAKNVTIDYCTFIKNIGLGSGAVDAGAGADGLIVKNTKFYNNTATADAGAILFVSATGNMFGYNLTFDGNSATNGGACRISGNNIIILNSIFNNNRATNNGGAVYLYSGSTCNISYCTFLGNNATYGGAVYISIPYTVISNCNFTKNTASLNGGAIYINANNVGVLKSNFINNRANDGCAIYMVSGGSNFEIKKSNFNQNIASNHGVIYLTGTSNLRLGENIFNNNQPAGINEYYYILNSSMFKASKLYVNSDGIGSGLTEDNPIAVDNVWEAIENNGVIVFLQGEYEISKALSQNYTFVGLDGAIIKRKGSGKYLFVLQNGVILNIANITLNAGVDVVGGSELNLDNVTFVASSNSDGGIIYETGSKGNIINSKFVGTSNLGDDHIVSVNGNVNINNTEFSGNSLKGSTLYYGNSGRGSITNSVFVNNTATNDVRNINIGDISKVTLSENAFDVNVTYNVTNRIYGSLAYINGNFDAGVNFEIDNVKLIINDTAKTNSTVTIGAINHNFSFNIAGKLAAGKYNLTVICNDGNVYYLNYSIDDFEITKANVTINNINDIAVSYGDNDTITITGSIVNNIYSGNNYTGIVSVIIGDSDAINATVNKNGTFTVNVNVKGFDAGIYALNVSVIGNGNYTGNSKKFNSYLTVKNATIAVISVNSIIVEYGVKEVIVNGTLNSTKFGDNYTGNITVTIAGLFNITQAVNGTFSVKITNSTPFKVGKYDISVSGEAITNYNAISSKSFSNALEVLNIVPNFVITSPSIGYGENATVYISLPSDATGKVVINASGKYVVIIDDVYGITNATIVLPVSGSYLINATYYGDDNYQGVSTNSTLFVERPRTLLNITVDDVFVGSDVLINFTIYSAVTGQFFDDAGGILRVYVGSSFYSVNITNGRGNLTVSGLSISAYNVVAIYNGDDNYAGCDAYANFQVKGYETFLNMTLNKNEIFVGGNISVSVKVNETINNYPIYLYIDGELFGILLTNNGAVVFNVDGLSAGVHNISAVFPATSSFSNASNKTTVNVVKNNPNFATEAIANSTNDIFIKFNLPDDATGIINVTYEGTVIKSIVVDGNRTISLGRYSTVGNYTFNLFYSGDDKYSESLSNSTVELGKISDYAMNITSTVIVRNKNVTIFVNLPDEFMNNGTVNLTINGDSEVISLVNSQVNKTIQTTGLDVIKVVATYSGFDNYAFKTISRVFEIKPTDEYEIRIIVDDACVGDNVTIKISAPEEINNVTLRVDTIGEVINLVNGNGSYNLSNVALGYHTIIVSYDGDELYYTAKTFYGGFNVTRKVLPVNVTAGNVTYQTPVPVSVDLGEKDVSGLVSILIDGKVYNYFELVDGKVNFNISDLNAGVHSIVVKYAGDDKYSNATSQEVLFNITRFSGYDMNVYYDSKLVVNGSMVDSGATTQLIISVELPKNAVGNVSLYIDGQFVNSINATKNLIFALGDYPTGIHNVSVVYEGDRNYNSSNFEFKLNVTSKLPANLIIVCPDVIHVNDKFNITILSNLNEDAMVSLFIDGAKLTQQKVSSNFTINGLSSGNHFITVNFEGNGLYHAGSNSTNITVLKWDSYVSVSAANIDVGENLIVDVNASGNGSAKIFIYNNAGNLVADYILSIDNGKGRIIVPYTFTEIGEYKINITYNGDDVYNISKNTTGFIVSLASDYEFKVITSDALVGDNVTVDVILPNNANKNVILKLANGTTLTQKLVNGTARFILPALVAGDYIVNATYEGDNNYNMTTKLGKFTIMKHDAVIDLSFNTTDKSAVEIINSIVQGEKTSLIIKLANDATGYVNVTVSSTKQFNNRNLVDGKLNITLDDLTHGNYNIVVNYSGDNKYNNASATIVLVVASAKPTIEIIPIADQMVGSDVNVSVKTNVGEGNVTLYLNGIEFNTTSIVNGWANFTIKSISADSQTVNVFVVYEANDIYAGAVNSTTFNVNKFTSSFDVTSSENNVTVRVDAGATGSVIVTFKGVNYTAIVNDSGVAVISLPNVPGSYKLPVYYSGDLKYYSNSTMVDVNIPWGDNYILNATVDSTGLVTVNVDSRVDNVTISCEGLIDVIVDFTVKGDIKVGYYQLPDDLAVGSHIVTVSYDGDDNLGPKSYSLIYNVEKIKDYPFNITVKADYVGNDVIIYVNLPDDATGFVVFTINGKGYSINLDETRNLTLSGLTNGTYSAVAKYVGDGNYSESHNTTEFTLIKRTSSINMTVNNIKVGQVEIITVNVSNGITGMVVLNINGDKYYVDIVNGTGSINITKLTNGTYTVNAYYDGNDIYVPSNATQVFNVTKISDYNIDADYSKVVNNATKITVTLPDDATGLVTITVNNTNFTGAIYKGKVVIEVTNITAASYDYVVNWEGDNKYVAGRTTGVIYNEAFRKDSQVIVSVDDIYVGGSALIKVNVTEGATGEVRISVNGRNIVVPLVNGSAKFSVGGFANGTVDVNVTYMGDRQFAQSSNSTTFKVSKYNSTISITTAGGSVGENIIIVVTGPSDASGDVEIIINGTTYNVVMNNGEALLNTTFDKYGLYNITANYKGNNKYNPESNVSSFNIDSLTSSVVVSVENIKVGENAIITVYVSEDASGIVTVTVDGVDYNVTVNNGKAVFNISNLANGTYDVLAKYNGDGKYASNTNTSSFNVTKIDIVPDVTSTLIVENQTNVTVNVAKDATGDITVFVNGASISSPINDGVAVFNLNNVVNGTEVRFVYAGDDKYNKFNLSAVLYGSGIKLASELSILSSNILVGEDAVITVTITDKATGNITINIAGRTVTKEINDGKVTFTIADLAYGTYNITATYAGDDNFLKSNMTSNMSVSKHGSFVIVSVGDIKVGENANITVSVPSDAGGNVTLMIGGLDYDPVIVLGGKAVFVIPNLGNGTYEVVATYNGDAKYLNSTGNATFKVSKVDVNPNVESTSVLDNKTTVTVIVPGDPGGNITIFVGSDKYTGQINDGKAIINISNVGNGTNITIVYEGDDKYNGFSKIAVVNDEGIRINPSITVVCDKSEYLAGETAVITITVPEDARGNVTIKINGEIINTTDVSQGMAVYNYTISSSGNFNVEVIYNGDNKYGKATNNTSFDASKVNSTVVIDVNSTEVGKSVVIVVYVPNDAAGKVIIVVDGNTYDKIVDGGKAVFNVDGLAKGNYTVAANFNTSDEKYNGNSNSTKFEVTARYTNLDVVVSPITYGEDAKIVVTVPVNATGYVTLTIGDDTYLVNIKDGNANFTISNLEPGVVNLEIAYSGDDDYYANITHANITVSPKSTSIDVIAGDIDKGDVAVITVIVSNDANGVVVITVGGKDYNTTIDGGIASVEISGLDAGTYNIVAKYLGNKYYANSTNDTVSFNVLTDSSIVAKVVSRMYGSDYDYEALFTDKAGNPLVNANVTFAVNGKEYNVVTDENGIARLPGGTLSVGNHTVVARNPVTGYETYNTTEIKPTLVDNKDINMDFKDGSKYSVRVIGADGKPVGAGVEVTIRINYVSYKVKTDKNGYARLSINLNPGKYTVTVTRNGYKISNEIHVKRTLAAKKTQVAKKSAKISKIKVSLKWSSGKAIKGKKVTMKFRGNLYKAKTNSKGIAVFKLPKKGIKNLKPGKTYQVKYTYLTDSIYKFIKIKK